MSGRIHALFGMDRATFDRELKERFQYEPPPPPAVVEKEREGRALDAAHFRSFSDLDRAYSPAARAKARRMAAELERDARQLTHEELVLRVAEIAALADNSHTAISQDALRKGTPRVPIRTMLFADGLFVLRASAGHEDLLGARIDTIEGRRIDSVYARLARYRGGLEAHRRLMLIPVLESPGLLNAAGLAPHPDRLSISGVLADGTPFERTIAAEQRDRAAPVSNTIRLLFPSSRSKPMSSFLEPTADLPIYLHSSTELFRLGELPSDGFYIAMTHNAGSDNQPLKQFLSEALARVERDKPGFLVVDMRMNGGGDYTKSYDFARALPAAAAGAPIYVITSPWTFSAAITTLAALEDAGGDQVTIVGEPVGDRLDFWAEGGAMELPNSGIQTFYSAARHNYAGPCTDRATCFWLNELYPVRVSTLHPDIPAPLTFAAYRAGRDPAMEAILERELLRAERG
ncbi:MAG: hypothetical protein ACR2JJ_12395 [Sphingomicrobium sp.]